MLTRRAAFASMAAQGALAMTPSLAWGKAVAGPVDFAALDARLAGDVLTPASADYGMARRTFSFSPRNDHHPAAIARCETPVDIARAIEFARRHDLRLSVRSGGHDVFAASVGDGSLVLDLRRMNGIRQGASGGSVIVGPAAQTMAVNAALARLGKAAVLGNDQVGVAGLTLGGGIGRLLGLHGAACDNLLRARLVTADGAHLIASDRENQDLFWALKGGGGNFGVLTELELKTHDIPTAVGGAIAYDARYLGEFLRFFPDYMANAPRELVVEFRVTAHRPPIMFVIVTYTGDTANADRVLAPLRKVVPVLADGIRGAGFMDVASPGAPVEALLRADAEQSQEWNAATFFDWRGGSLVNFDERAVQVMVDRVAQAPRGPWAISLGHHMHGAICEVDSHASAMPRPRNSMSYHFDAWWADPAQSQESLAWVDASMTAMMPFNGQTYINYLSSDDPAGIAAAYGDRFARLRQLKRRYDADNVFRGNRNIPPKR